MAVVLVLVTGTLSAQSDQPTIFPIVRTAPLCSYEDAPATPDADDPAIWINRHDSPALAGHRHGEGRRAARLRSLRAAWCRRSAAECAARARRRPADARRLNLAPDRPCADSASGETFGRFNNVDIAYGVRLGRGHRAAARRRRGRFRSRMRSRPLLSGSIPSHPDGPLVDITAPDVPRVFPPRYDQPSALQPSGAVEGWRDNPVDDQNTVYGLTVAQAARDTRSSSSSANAAWCGSCSIVPRRDGTADLSARADVPLRHDVSI